MCKFVGFIAFLVIGFAGGVGIGIPTKLLLAFAILNVIFVFLLFVFKWISGWALNPLWRYCYIDKINIPCVFGFLKDQEYDTWTVQVTTTYYDGRPTKVRNEERNNACMVYTIDFFIGFFMGLVCPLLLLYLLVWYVYCIATSIQLYLAQRRNNQIYPTANKNDISGFDN
jgi:hypothetical protein